MRLDSVQRVSNPMVLKMLLFCERAGWVALGLVVLAGTSASPAVGQTTRLEPGTRLRVTIPCTEQVPTQSPTRGPTCPTEGRLLRLASDSLTLESNRVAQTYAISSVVRAEVGDRGSYRSLGAGIGAVAGATATFVALNAGGSTAYCNQSANQDSIDPGPCFGLYALGALAGAGLGALLGGRITRERWEVVPLESLRIGLLFRQELFPDLALRVVFDRF